MCVCVRIVYFVFFCVFLSSFSTGGSVAILVARRTNDRKVAGSRPTKAVCISQRSYKLLFTMSLVSQC